MTSTPPTNDDGRTAMPQGLPTSFSPTTPQGTASSQNALPAGTTLGEFEITGIIGEGGFGIVYRAYDHSLQREIALKEYMPSALAGRSAGATVAVRSEKHAETFQAGLRSFINEARLLAQFDHPSLVKVYRFWEGNGTAYMVMPLYLGVTLKEVLSARSCAPDEAWLKRLLAQLLEALEIIHRDHCLHRDIAPDNILIQPDGRPLLLDFGAARRVIGNMTQSLTVILKPGYAPVEQYAEVASMKQGPWTDIYALAAVVYFAVTGHPPMPSVGRIVADSLVPLSKAAKGRYSPAFLEGVDRALSVKPEDRPRSVSEMRALLGLAERRLEVPQTGEQREPPPHGPRREPVAAGHGRRGGLYIAVAVAVALVVAAGAGVFVLRDRPPPVADTAPQPLPPPPPIAQEKEFDPLRALDEIFEWRDRNHAVTVSAGRAQARIGQDPLRFKIRSARDGYVYLLMVGTDRSDFFLLFPNAVDKNNPIRAGEELDLPRPRWKMIADGPPGTDHFVVIVSERPRDFSAAGLKSTDPFAEFPFDAAARLYRKYDGSVPLFAGKAICPPDLSAKCPESYGAAVFSIEEIAAPQKPKSPQG
jgi:serine/threonine protein kinase